MTGATAACSLLWPMGSPERGGTFTSVARAQGEMCVRVRAGVVACKCGDLSKRTEGDDVRCLSAPGEMRMAAKIWAAHVRSFLPFEGARDQLAKPHGCAGHCVQPPCRLQGARATEVGTHGTR